MPPQLVDLDSLVRVGDSKVACESTLITGPRPEPDPDLPAESFRVSVSDLDWVVSISSNQLLDRDDSTKGTTNPKSHLHHHNQPPAGPTTSQRFSGNLKATAAKAPIIGLPNRIQHSGYLGRSARRAQVRIFPKKGGVNVSDPGSPKVSCFGRVASQRERRGSPEIAGGCWASLFGCFRRPKEEEATATATATAVRNERSFPARERRAEVAPAAEPPGLGGMKRFVSGRRPASWGGDVEFDLEGEEIGHVAWSGPLDRR